MAYITYSENGSNPLTKLLGHNPDLLKNWMALRESFFDILLFLKKEDSYSGQLETN
jgi:hypothetical protein